MKQFEEGDLVQIKETGQEGVITKFDREWKPPFTVKILETKEQNFLFDDEIRPSGNISDLVKGIYQNDSYIKLSIDGSFTYLTKSQAIHLIKYLQYETNN